jgi:hypothetical protein
MANEWIHLEGKRQIVRYPSETTIARGVPCYLSSNLIVACTDGTSLDVVTAEPCVSGDNTVTCILPSGDLFRVKVKSGTNLAPGDLCYTAGTNLVDDGSVGNISVGTVVNYNPATSGCAEIAVWSAFATRKIHA